MAHADEKTASRERSAHRRRRRRRFYRRLIILAVILLVVVLVISNREILAPDRLVDTIGGLIAGNTGSGFPIDVSGSQVYQLETADNCTVLLSDTYITMIDTNGNEVMRRAHAFSAPQLRTAGRYALVAERGGKRLQLETRSKTVQTLTTNYDILTCAVYKNGNMAVVTAAEQGYNATVSVYTASGRLIYQRLCSNLVADVAFSPDGKQLAMATVSAVSGALHSTIEIVTINSDQSETLYHHGEDDVLLCRIQYISSGTIAAVGDTAVWMYHPKKDTCQVYPLSGGALKSFAIGEDSVLVLTEPYGTTAGGNIAYIKTDGSATFSATVDGTCRDVSVDGNRYAVLTDAYIYQINSKGILGSRIMTEDGKMVAVSGNRVFVLGLKYFTKYTLPNHLLESD